MLKKIAGILLITWPLVIIAITFGIENVILSIGLIAWALIAAASVIIGISLLQK